MKEIIHALSLTAIATSVLFFAPPVLSASSTVGIGFVPLGHLLSMAEGRPWTPLPPPIAEGTRAGVARDQARIYMAGVVDSGEALRWCIGATGIPPYEVQMLLVSRLSERVDVEPEITDDNAASWMAVVLEKEFPCGE